MSNKDGDICREIFALHHAEHFDIFYIFALVVLVDLDVVLSKIHFFKYWVLAIWQEHSDF